MTSRKIPESAVENLVSDLEGKANIALTNSPYTTNRILEIPQDIKLELNNGTLTLKAGSKVYVPNGPGVFDAVNIHSDIVFTQESVAGKNFLFYTTGNALTRHQNVASGTSVPSGFTGIFYNTATNQIYYCNNGTGTASSKDSFPIAIITVADDKTANVTSIDQVFNGFGYIGSTVFVLPGVKVQIPSGRNADGTCKSIYGTIRTVQQTSVIPGNGNFSIRIGDNYIAVSKFVYDEETNYNYNQTVSPSNIRYQTNAGTVSYLSGKITSFEPYTVDSVVNSNLSNLSAAGQAKFDAKANVSNTVTTNTAQTITGFKAFNSGSGNNRTNIDIITNDGVAEDTNTKWAGSIQFKKGNVDVGFCEAYKDGANSSIAQITARNSVNGQGVYASLRSVVTSDGIIFAMAPTPSASAAGEEIVTAGWVNSKMQVVSALPAEPDPNVFYFIPE